MPNEKTQHHSALRSKNFRIFLYGNTISVLGIWIQRLALGWQAWQLSESSLMVGLVAAMQFLPLLLLTPFFGVFVDRIRPRYGMIVMHCVLMLIATVLGMLTLTDRMTIEILLLLSLLHGIANSAYSPIRLALIPDLVEQSQFPSAVAISSVIFNTSRFVGPGLAGTIVSLWGLGFAYIANAVTYIPVILSLLIIRTIRQRPQPAKNQKYLAQLAEGLRYTRDHPTIRQVILIAGISVFFGRGVLELMPAFAALIFDGGSDALAALMAAAGAGAILTSLIFSVIRLHSHLHLAVLVGALGTAVSIFLFALAGSITGGIAAIAMLGFFSSMVSIGSQSEVQISVDDRLRGRVLSLWTLVIIGGPAIGSIVAGWLAHEIGSTYTLMAFAAISLTLIVSVAGRKKDSTAAEKPV
jgi:MFS family permease